MTDFTVPLPIAMKRIEDARRERDLHRLDRRDWIGVACVAGATVAVLALVLMALGLM